MIVMIDSRGLVNMIETQCEFTLIVKVIDIEVLVLYEHNPYEVECLCNLAKASYI